MEGYNVATDCSGNKILILTKEQFEKLAHDIDQYNKIVAVRKKAQKEYYHRNADKMKQRATEWIRNSRLKNKLEEQNSVAIST